MVVFIPCWGKMVHSLWFGYFPSFMLGKYDFLSGLYSVFIRLGVFKNCQKLLSICSVAFQMYLSMHSWYQHCFVRAALRWKRFGFQNGADLLAFWRGNKASMKVAKFRYGLELYTSSSLSISSYHQPPLSPYDNSFHHHLGSWLVWVQALSSTCEQKS